MEALDLFGFGQDEIEEARLRHHRQEREARSQAAEVGHRGHGMRGDEADLGGARMILLQQTVGEPELVHQFQRRGVNHVPAKLAIEIRARFRHENRAAFQGEEIAEHQAGGSCADDAAGHMGG